MINRSRTLAVAIAMFCALEACELSAQSAPVMATTNQPLQAGLTMMGTGLRVVDLTVALRFYRDGLGMREVARFSSNEFDEIVLDFGEKAKAPPIFLLQSRGPKTKVGRRPLVKGDKIILAISEIAVMIGRLEAMGYAPGPISRDAKTGVQQSFVADPDGHRFEIVQRSPTLH